MPRGIKLQRKSIKNANHWHLRVFRLRIDAVEATPDMPKEVFVYRRHPPDPYDGTIFDEFCTVASVVDLSEYPVGAPNPDKAFPFFRKDFIEVDLRSMAEFSEVWDLIVTHVCNLAETLDLADILVIDDEAVCGELPEGSESESVSESESTTLPSLALFALTLGQLSSLTIEQLHQLPII